MIFLYSLLFIKWKSCAKKTKEACASWILFFALTKACSIIFPVDSTISASPDKPVPCFSTDSAHRSSRPSTASRCTRALAEPFKQPLWRTGLHDMPDSQLTRILLPRPLRRLILFHFPNDREENLIQEFLFVQ